MLIPNEEHIKDGSIHGKTAFRTTDHTTYIRDVESNVIRKVSNEVKGKAAKKKAKRMNRALKTRPQKQIAQETAEIPQQDTKKKETTEELVARLKGMMK